MFSLNGTLKKCGSVGPGDGKRNNLLGWPNMKSFWQRVLARFYSYKKCRMWYNGDKSPQFARCLSGVYRMGGKEWPSYFHISKCYCNTKGRSNVHDVMGKSSLRHHMYISLVLWALSPLVQDCKWHHAALKFQGVNWSSSQTVTLILKLE